MPKGIQGRLTLLTNKGYSWNTFTFISHRVIHTNEYCLKGLFNVVNKREPFLYNHCSIGNTFVFFKTFVLCDSLLSYDIQQYLHSIFTNWNKIYCRITTNHIATAKNKWVFKLFNSSFCLRHRPRVCRWSR